MYLPIYLQYTNLKLTKMTNATEYLNDNRNKIISTLQNEIKRKTAVCGRTATDLKGAMMIYKEVFENTNQAWKAKEAAIEAIGGNIKVSKYAFLSDASKRQLGSSMR